MNSLKINRITVLASLLLSIATAQAQVNLVRLPVVEKGDTLLCGVFREADAVAFKALLDEYDELMQKQLSTKAKQEGSELLQNDLSDNSSQKKKTEVEDMRAKALKEIAKLPEGLIDKKKQAKEINDMYDRMIAELPGLHESARKDIIEIDKKLTTHDASEYSNEKKYDVKRRMAALAVGGRLLNYVKSRDFRHGRAAVTIEVRVRSKADGAWIKEERWGFIDEQGRRVIPCRYSRVFDFNNRKFQSGGVFDKMEDQDDRPWTTAWDTDYHMGMIDADGRTVIPHKFITARRYSCICFYKTKWGELAPVRDAATSKYGIINRNGHYTMQPTQESVIVWYTDVKCFGTTGEGRTFFDAYGKKIEH